MAGVAVSTTINGDNVEYLCQPDETLLDVLRDRLGLTGAKEGCGTGDCGACSVMYRGVYRRWTVQICTFREISRFSMVFLFPTFYSVS